MVVHAVSPERNRRLLGVAVRALAAGVAIGGVLTALALCGFGVATRGADAWNYLSAGERLNAGHALYALAAGDRAVEIVPPYWTVPLLAPPPIAVAWRPLALLGDPAMTVWGLATIGGAVLVAVALLRRDVLRGLAALALVAAPLSITALWGNVNALVAPALMGAWWLRRRPLLVGPLLAFAISMKVTPVFFLLWLVFARRWRAVGATVVAGLAILLVGVAGAGVPAWTDWLAAAPGAAPSPLGLARLLGTSTGAVYLLGALTVVAVAVVTRSEAAVYVACGAAAALTTPALYHQAIALLVVCAAPFVDHATGGRALTWRAVRPASGDALLRLPATGRIPTPIDPQS